MKKRIISMLLVVVMLVASLASCAYSYESDDMSQYATLNEKAFLDGLKTLEIEDADFGIDEDVRWEKVADAIVSSLAGKIDADTKVTDKAPGKNDLLYYCYYATYEKDGKEITVYASSMKESSAVKLQLGLNDPKELDEKIEDALLAIDGFTLADFAYKTKTTGTTAEGNSVVVTYTRTVPTADGGTNKVTYTNKILADLPAKVETPTSFEEYLVGVTVGSTLESKDFKETVDGKEVTVTYSGVKVNWIVESDLADAVTVTHKPFTEEKKVNAVDGTSVDLKDVELTYHVYPVYFNELPELDATIILKELLGTSLKAGGDADKDGKVSETEEGTLPVFTNDAYKNGNDTVNTLVTKLVELLGDLSEAKTEYEDATDEYDDEKTEYDKLKNPTAEQTKKLEDAKKAKDDAEKAKNDADKAVDDQITKILAAKASGSDAKAIADLIVEEYKQYRYDALEKTYESAIKKNLAAAIFELANKNIEYKKDADGNLLLPKKAVDEAYDRLINNYEYDFYEGTYSSSSSSSSTGTSSKTNYEYFNGVFVDFLRNELKMKETDSNDAVYAKIRSDAEASVKDTVFIYVLKNACKDEDVSVTAEDVETFKKSINYLLLQYQMGADGVKESYYMPALQLDNIFNYFLEVKEGDDKDNKIDYVRLSYTFKADDDKDDSSK